MQMAGINSEFIKRKKCVKHGLVKRFNYFLASFLFEFDYPAHHSIAIFTFYQKSFGTNSIGSTV